MKSTSSSRGLTVHTMTSDDTELCFVLTTVMGAARIFCRGAKIEAPKARGRGAAGAERGGVWGGFFSIFELKRRVLVHSGC